MHRIGAILHDVGILPIILVGSRALAAGLGDDGYQGWSKSAAGRATTSIVL
jgi:hypothetical protein